MRYEDVMKDVFNQESNYYDLSTKELFELAQEKCIEVFYDFFDKVKLKKVECIDDGEIYNWISEEKENLSTELYEFKMEYSQAYIDGKRSNFYEVNVENMIKDFEFKEVKHFMYSKNTISKHKMKENLEHFLYSVLYLLSNYDDTNLSEDRWKTYFMEFLSKDKVIPNIEVTYENGEIMIDNVYFEDHIQDNKYMKNHLISLLLMYYELLNYDYVDFNHLKNKIVEESINYSQSISSTFKDDHKKAYHFFRQESINYSQSISSTFKDDYKKAYHFFRQENI